MKEVKKENRRLFIKDQIKNTFDLNLEAILDDFKTIGKDLVDKINIKTNSTIFE